MRKSLKQPRVLVAVVGVLVLLASLALAAGSARPTEATWQDTVQGESVFSADPSSIKTYARAIGGNGIIKRTYRFQPHVIQSARAFADPRTPAASQPLNHSDSGPGDIQPLQVAGTTCAGVGARSAADCGATATIPPASSYAKSEVSSLKMWAATFRGVENVIFESSPQQAPITATATCVPGRDGQANATAGGPILLRGSTPLHLPPGERQTSASDRGLFTHNISGVLQVHQSQGPGWAKSEVRLYVENDYPLSSWTLHVVLASAECGIGRDPERETLQPTTARPSALPESPNRPLQRSLANSASLRTIPEMAEDQPAEAPDSTADQGAPAVDEDGSGTDLPSLDGAANDESARETDEVSAAPATTTSAPAKTAETAASIATEQGMPESQSSTTVPETSEPASSESSVPTEVAPATTEQNAAADGPQEPETVRVGQEFAVVNRGGVELGTAKVQDIVRTPGCGVELTLSLTTSAEAGPDRWATIAPTDFAEVRAGGSIRKAGRLSSECEQVARSRTTALSPGRDYEITIAFRLSDTAQRAMLQPDGTAGWVFDLPPLPRATATTSPKAPASAPATTAAPAASEVPSTNSPSEEPAADTAEA